MKCPVCKTPDLMMTERQSIEIDYCPTCRGVWLDRGELDKLIAQVGDTPETLASARSRDDGTHYAQSQARRYDEHRRDDRRHDDRSHDGYRDQHGRYRKKRSLFDMFDFD
ncbi:MAG TPA: zf-TFIIB domain-containing protein [Paraburkholderia sp.]|jgi:Zn-finger nucleic acid-binding protein|nr:zf-TFIIB domain-containing protein [Paraburkholderia sp.]